MSEILLQKFMSGLGEFTGVFLGVIAGAAITLAVEEWKSWRTSKQELTNLHFEIENNIAKIDTWLQDVTEWRNAVNGDNLTMYFGYFKLSAAFFATTNTMFLSGRLYNVLTHENLTKLQEVMNDHTIFSEQYLNNQILQKKQKVASLIQDNNLHEWHRSFKQECINEINFWDKKFRENREKLEKVKSNVKEKIT